MLAVLIGGVATASATAGVVVALTGQPSAPVAGPFLAPSTTPGAAARELGRYAVVMSPNLQVGKPGWCLGVQIQQPPHDRYGGRGCGPAATRRNPKIIGGGDQGGALSLSYVVVDERVVALDGPGGSRILPTTAPGLPSGWKIAIELGKPGADPRADPFPRPGHTLYDRRPVDADGQRVGGRPLSPNHDLANFVGDQASSNVTSGRAPADATCAIPRPGGRPWSKANGYRVLRHPARAQPKANGRPFLTCAQVTVPTIGRRLQASVLIDAREPGDLPADLPGLTPGVAGTEESRTPATRPAAGTTSDAADGIVGSRLLSMSARRIGNAWLVVVGPSPTARAAFLKGLTVRVDLP